MKTLSLFYFFVLCANLSAQRLNLETILIKTEKALSKIQNGYYEYQIDFKYFTDPAIEKTEGKFYFDRTNKAKKIIVKGSDEDGSFEYEQFYNPTQGFYSLSPKDKTYWPDSIWKENKNTEMIFYFKKTNYFGAEVLKDTNFSTVSLLSDTVIGDKKCYRIKYNLPDNEPLSNSYRIISIEQKKFIPLCLESNYVLTQLADNQYSKLTITNFDFNQKKYKKEVAFRPIPADYSNLKDKPAPSVRFIEVGDTLPEFEYKNLTSQNINFDNIKQDYVLLDFWYIGCFPCILASTFIDTLSTQYKDKNLFVLGINTQDTSESKISDFKKKKNISYPNILMGYEEAKLLPVFAYPTMVIIERKTRRVIYVQTGYGEEMKQPMIDFIDKNIAR